MVFVNNKNSNTIDVFNLFQKKFIKKINHQIASIGYFFEFNSYAVKRDPPFSPNLGIRKNITNAVYILNDSSSFYFLSTQNSELYFTKINKSDYSEIWKFKINPTGRLAFTMSNNKIVFFTDRAVFKSVNSNVDVPVSSGLVIYNTDGLMLKTFKIDNGRENSNPFFVQKKDTLLLGLDTFGQMITTDSFKLAPINGNTNIAVNSKIIIARENGDLVSPWSNAVKGGKPYSSDTSILEVTFEWNGLLSPRFSSFDYYLKAKKIGKTFLTYNFKDLNGKEISTSIPIEVKSKETNNPFNPDFCLLSFDKDLNYQDNKYFTAQVQGGYYDINKDSLFFYGTTTLNSGCCNYNGMKLNDSLTFYSQGFNYIVSFKNLKSYNYSLIKFDKNYSQGFGSTIFFDNYLGNNLFYMPFKGSILFNKPYTSLSGTGVSNGDNFLVGFMDRNDPSSIDESKSLFFGSLNDVSAGLIKSKNNYYLTTQSNNFFVDKKYIDTGLYILTFSKDKVIDPDSVGVYNYLCAPPKVNNYTFCNNQPSSQLSVLTNGTNTALWYGNNAIGGISNSNAPIPPTSNIGTTFYYVSQKNILLGCESERSKIQVTVKSVPVVPIISRDSLNFLVSNSNISTVWFKDGMQLIDTAKKIKPIANGLYSAKTYMDGCFSVFSNSYYYLVTDIINLSTEEYIKLAPNPFINQLNLDFVIKGYQRLNLEVFDLATGIRKGSMQNLTPGMPISLGQLSAGTYYIRVSSNDGKINHQFKMVKL